jgi:uncharacterized protein YqjF (DUF2071 family)
MRMHWSCLAFFHWPIDPRKVRHLVHEGLEIDTFDGRAWVGLVPFTMPLVRHVGWPRVPTMNSFHECNVRTYVTRDGVPGVWFFSLDAASRLAVWGARTFWNLPYHHARIDLRREGARIEYGVRRSGDARATMRCAWEVGAPLPRSTPDTLAHFLAERYCLYSVDRGGRLMRGRIQHDPWPLREARVVALDDGLVRAAGIDLDIDPRANPAIAYHADDLHVDAWGLESC